jgi:hypothetical protein
MNECCMLHKISDHEVFVDGCFLLNGAAGQIVRNCPLVVFMRCSFLEFACTSVNRDVAQLCTLVWGTSTTCMLHCIMCSKQKQKSRHGSDHCAIITRSVAQTGTSSGDPVYRDMQGRQEYELMIAECIDMLYQIIESAKCCAQKRSRVAAQGKAADVHSHTAASATIQAAHHEERAAELTSEADAVKKSAETEGQEATELKQEAKTEADKAALAREAACVATWQGAAARQACEMEVKDMEGAMNTLSKQQDAFQAMMTALGVAIAAATLRRTAGVLDEQNAKAAGRARAADAQAEAAASLAADMKYLAEGLTMQGKEEVAILAERQREIFERESAEASDVVAVHLADAAALHAKATMVAEQAAAGEGQVEASVEVHMQLQQLAETLQGIREQQKTVADARGDALACTALQKEQLALSKAANAEAESMKAEGNVLRAHGKMDEAACVAELAMKRRAEGEAAQRDADEQRVAAQQALQAAKNAEARVHTLEQSAQDMQVRCKPHERIGC